MVQASSLLGRAEGALALWAHQCYRRHPALLDAEFDPTGSRVQSHLQRLCAFRPRNLLHSADEIARGLLVVKNELFGETELAAIRRVLEDVSSSELGVLDRS